MNISSVENPYARVGGWTVTMMVAGLRRVNKKEVIKMCALDCLMKTNKNGLAFILFCTKEVMNWFLLF